MILDSSIMLSEYGKNTSLLKQGYSISLDKIRYQDYPEKDVIFLSLYKHGNVVQKITVNESDLFFYTTTIDGTEYTIIQANVIIFYGTSGHNLISLNPILQYSDGTAYEPFIADSIFQVPGINAPVEEWNRTFGGPHHEEDPQFLLLTPDEGFTIAGQRTSYAGYEYQDTVWLIHTDTEGYEQWNRILKDVIGYGYSIDQTRDGGYIFLGETRNSQTRDHKDAYLTKLDENGEQQWKKTIENLNSHYSIRQTADGGYIIAALRRTYISDNIITRLIKTNKQGREQWSRNLVGFTFFPHFIVRQTADRGYILAGDILPENVGLFKTDAAGNEQWQLTIPGDHINSIIQTQEGDYVFAGSMDSEAWLGKVDAQGRKQWDMTFGLEGDDYAKSVLQTSDGGYILAGQLDSAKDPDFKDQILYDNKDAWLIKTDLHGNLEWTKIFGGPGADRAISVLQTPDGGYILAGSTETSSSKDIRIIKIAGTVNTTTIRNSGIVNTTTIKNSGIVNTTAPLSDLNETSTPTTPGFELTGVLISITLLLFLLGKLVRIVKNGQQ